jgi:hypothetical protein
MIDLAAGIDESRQRIAYQRLRRLWLGRILLFAFGFVAGYIARFFIG